MPRDRRKIRLIDHTLQTRLVLRSLGFLAACFGLFLFLLCGVPLVFGWFGGEMAWGEEEASYRWNTVARVALLPTLSAAFLYFAMGTREMARIAGPNVRIVRVLRDLSRGRITRSFDVRRSDYLQETAQALDASFHFLRTQVEQMDGHLSKLESQLGADGVDLDQARLEAARLRACLDQFETVEEPVEAQDEPSEPTLPTEPVPA